MSDRDLLPPDVEDWLRAERGRVDAPESGRARLAERLAAVVPAFGAPHAPPTLPPTPHLGATAAGGAWKAVVAKTALALALGGGAVATVEVARHGGDARATARSAEAPVIARPAAAPPADRAPPPLAPPTVVAELPAPRASAAPVSAAQPQASASTATREEQRLLDDAHAALGRGEPEIALGLTERHAARFPAGSLAPVRDALRIRALARLGLRDEARSRLDAMRARYPESFLLEGASSDVAAIP